MPYFAKGGVNEVLSADDMKAALSEVFEKLGRRGKVLAVTPDITRLTFEYYGRALTDILPALGTHAAMR